ncbi:MAG: hypothetical protein R3Y12_06900 [Clostridia bacterium]
MKKIIALILSVAMCSSLVACSEQMEINLPASMFSGYTEEEIANEAQYYYCKSHTINEDGSVTYVLSENAYNNMLKSVRSEVDTTIANMLAEDSDVPAFKKITYNDDLTEVFIYVDPELFEEYLVVYAITFYASGVYYQTYSGVAEEDIDILVKFINVETNQGIKTGTYKEYLLATAT